MNTDENTFRVRLREERRMAVARLINRAQEMDQAKSALAFAEREHAAAQAALDDIEATYKALGMDWSEVSS